MYLSIYALYLTESEVSFVSQYRVHESGVNTMTIRQQGDAWLIHTGGDDGNVLCTIFRSNEFTEPRLLWQHWSAVQGCWAQDGHVVSVGWDQVIRSTMSQCWTDVVDVSAMALEVWQDSTWVAIGGQGIEILQL